MNKKVADELGGNPAKRGEADGTNAGSPDKAVRVRPLLRPLNSLSLNQRRKEGTAATQD